uniref:GIY-YIG endonuclease n=1 Tax=Spizellomyces sp. 'palustris' TaxID=117820 RepID=UPI0010FC2503|nr:GIY-YIG endonuclease [Spizellomyces sp. 'palustris']QCQ69032.1 GIY-YIG endonuclease [Spizellomyces sp. 'palustris']
MTNPAVRYGNAWKDRLSIIKENKDRAGVYKIYSIDDPSRFYIGSSGNLGNRLDGYLYKPHIHATGILRKAILKYGWNKLAIDILTYTEPDKSLFLAIEDSLLKEFKPTWNILFDAFSILGYKHTPEMRNHLQKKLLNVLLQCIFILKTRFYSLLSLGLQWQHVYLNADICRLKILPLLVNCSEVLGFSL